MNVAQKVCKCMPNKCTQQAHRCWQPQTFHAAKHFVRTASGIISGQRPAISGAAGDSKDTDWQTSRPSSREQYLVSSRTRGFAVMVMRKLGPCQPGQETGIKFLITSQIMIYPPPNGCCGPFTSVQFQRPGQVGAKTQGLCCDSNVKTHFSRKKSTRARLGSLGHRRKKRLKRIHFNAASMHARLENT